MLLIFLQVLSTPKPVRDVYAIVDIADSFREPLWGFKSNDIGVSFKLTGNRLDFRHQSSPDYVSK